MTTLVFGHKSPDTDATGSAIIWAWYLEHTGTPAEPRVLGIPNGEALFVLEHWGFEMPPVLDTLPEGTKVVVVDTNNPAELPEGIGKADIRAIIDHHKLAGGLETRGPIEVTIRPLASTATLMYQLMDGHGGHAPRGIKGLILSCILSDTLEFRSPTTTETDRRIAGLLARDLDIDIPAYAAAMFAAKSDVSALSDAELLRVDAKEYSVDGLRLRISVLETTSPAAVLDRAPGLVAAMPAVAAEEGADLVLLFVIDILREEAVLLTPDALTRGIAEKSFGVSATGDRVTLPGIMSRKKQIVPMLKVN